MSTTELLEEYRPAWEIEPGWEIRTADGSWLRVTEWREYTSSDVAKPDMVELFLSDVSSCVIAADDTVMTRKRKRKS